MLINLLLITIFIILFTVYSMERFQSYYMNHSNSELERLLSLSKEELETIFSQLSIEEVKDLLEKLHGDVKND